MDSSLANHFRAWQWTGASDEPCTSLPLTDRGFRYGMSVFESLRVSKGVPEFFERHLSRLIQACAERDIAVDEKALAAAETVFEGDGFARLSVTAGDGSPASAADQPRILAFIEDRRPPNHEDPWEITFHDETYYAPFGGMKTGNYWFNCEALALARRKKFDETLLFNERAELVSASMANIFIVHDDRILTPPRGSGARMGVIREWVVKRRKVEERRLRREDVLSADEIFLTNSWIGVMPVATVEGRPLGPRDVGPRLAAELERRRSE